PRRAGRPGRPAPGAPASYPRERPAAAKSPRWSWRLLRELARFVVRSVPQRGRLCQRRATRSGRSAAAAGPGRAARETRERTPASTEGSTRLTTEYRVVVSYGIMMG